MAEPVVKLCTVEEVKAFGSISNTNKDTLIDSLIDVVLPVFNQRYSRELMPQVTESRTFKLYGRILSMQGSDLRSVTSLTLNKGNADEALLVTGDFQLDIDSYDNITKSYSAIEVSKKLIVSSETFDSFGYIVATVSGAWGCFADVANVPSDIKQAAIETVSSWLNKPAQTIANQLDNFNMPGTFPTAPSTWDIPSSAHRKMQAYSRADMAAY